ncbi:hypothetical protein ACX84Z_27175, partial [Burkholderia pseudomallei]
RSERAVGRRVRWFGSQCVKRASAGGTRAARERCAGDAPATAQPARRAMSVRPPRRVRRGYKNAPARENRGKRTTTTHLGRQKTEC